MGQSQLFPPAYAPWLASRLAGEVSESLATCEACAMAAPTGLTRDPGPFQAHLKCCTYFPFIPNFSLGSLLATSADAKLRLAVAENQGLLLPLGLYATPERRDLMEGRNGANGFGQRAELLCPFFDVGREACSIWTHRPGVCTTYFCKSERGAAGLEFWSEVEKYLNYFEWVMAQEIFKRLGLGENEIEMCKAIMTTEEGDEERAYFLQYAWGSWALRKVDFFFAAAGCARQITPSDLDQLLGPEYLKLEAAIRQRI